MRQIVCECRNEDCPCHDVACAQTPAVILYMAHGVDTSGTVFCPACAAEALKSGLFTNDTVRVGHREGGIKSTTLAISSLASPRQSQTYTVIGLYGSTGQVFAEHIQVPDGRSVWSVFKDSLSEDQLEDLDITGYIPGEHTVTAPCEDSGCSARACDLPDDEDAEQTPELTLLTDGPDTFETPEKRKLEGRRMRTKVPDQNDTDCGEVFIPVGHRGVIGKFDEFSRMYPVIWDQIGLADAGWTFWTEDEIRRDAELL